MAGNPAFIFVNPTIKIGPVGTAEDYVCELTRAELTNDVSMIDTGSLCGPAQQPGKISWTLELEGYQGFDTDNLWMFLWNNSRQEAQFELVPKDEAVGTSNPSITGTVICVPATVGGTREEVATFSVSLPLIGDPALSTTPPAGTFAASASSSS